MCHNGVFTLFSSATEVKILAQKKLTNFITPCNNRPRSFAVSDPLVDALITVRLLLLHGVSDIFETSHTKQPIFLPSMEYCRGSQSFGKKKIQPSTWRLLNFKKNSNWTLSFLQNLAQLFYSAWQLKTYCH